MDLDAKVPLFKKKGKKDSVLKAQNSFTVSLI